jgi:hypothetical protein
MAGHAADQVLLPDVAQPFVLVDAVRELAAQLDRAVGAEAVHHHDLVAPGEALQAAADVPLLVERGDTG